VKRLCIVLVGMVALWLLPVRVSAQGMLGTGGTTSFAALPFSWPSNVAGCNNPSASGIFGMPNVYFGYLTHPRGSTWTLRRNTLTATAAWTLKGYWLGATEDLTLGDRLGLLVGGSAFFPQHSRATWHTDPATTPFDFDVRSYEWWTVDGLAKGRVSDSFDVLAGFRWDHTSTRVRYSDNTDDDYILNLYLPIIGAQVNQTFGNGSLLVRLLVAPFVPGTMRYHFWSRTGFSEFGNFSGNNGSLVEVFADYSLRVSRDLSVGGFAKWDTLHIRTAERNLSDSTTEPISWSIDIRSWTFGASLSLGFASPI
jgi:hypothetical protein